MPKQRPVAAWSELIFKQGRRSLYLYSIYLLTLGYVLDSSSPNR